MLKTAAACRRLLKLYGTKPDWEHVIADTLRDAEADRVKLAEALRDLDDAIVETAQALRKLRRTDTRQIPHKLTATRGREL